jgi:hypothetical protein
VSAKGLKLQDTRVGDDYSREVKVMLKKSVPPYLGYALRIGCIDDGMVTSVR